MIGKYARIIEHVAVRKELHNYKVFVVREHCYPEEYVVKLQSGIEIVVHKVLLEVIENDSEGD